MTAKFYKCNSCGNVILKLVDSGVPVVCCAKNMTLLEPTPVTSQNRELLPHVEPLEGGGLRLTMHKNSRCDRGDSDKSFLYLEFEHGGIWLKDHAQSDLELRFGTNRPVALYKYCTHHGLLWLKL